MEAFYHKNSTEIWGGVECTIVRVRNQVHDQLTFNGHEERKGDLALLADLGIKKIRYPLLWEKYFKDPDKFFKVHDERLLELERLGIKPIAGLLHHGSGPFSTDLLDPGFPEKLAHYAGIIASRYPHIDMYTPVNEPLTTARFSGLYGIWYPHNKDDHSFSTIFLNEMKGIILSMKEVRKYNANAVLIQTEDLCRIHSTPELQYQADFENERRWLTYDILNGLFSREHYFYSYFINAGIKEQDLQFFIGHDIRPEICGFNYYVTSERFLDHRYSAYPLKKRGGNGRQRYADVECVRVEKKPYGSYRLLREAWERYKRPIALSEVHLGCTREEQMRWFLEAYRTAERLREEGIDMRAITAWSLLGSFGWSSLLRRNLQQYESGVFDLSGGVPRPTALAGLIRKIASGDEITQPLLDLPGWWNRDIRLIYSKKNKTDTLDQYLLSETENHKHVSPLMIIGASGALGSAIIRICRLRGIVYLPLNRNDMDITSEESILRRIDEIRPWAVVNAAGYSKIDEAEREPIRCFRENTMGAIVLARICAKKDVKLITFSTDQVFNGKKRNPYVEKDVTAPLNTFGLSKRMAEERILAVNPMALIIRSSSFFNPWNPRDYLVQLLTEGLNNGFDSPRHFASDIVFSPAYVPELINMALDLLEDEETGIWHISSKEGLSNYEFVRMAANISGVDDRQILPINSGQLKFAAERPSYSLLMSSRGIALPPIEQLLHSFLREFKKSLTKQLSFKDAQ